MSSAMAWPCSSRSARVVVVTASQAVAATEQTAMRTEAISSRTDSRLRSGMRALRVPRAPRARLTPGRR
ncbi:hypothetical protein [Streptomyces sp. NPDC002328]|uniref:hypothetical protein n=1 Tax=Streptomyces sp. NPDC002328 TaxID=3364642 RepID=UPI0036A2AD3F